MSDFLQARFAASYTPEGRQEVQLTRYGQLLPGEPEEEWSGGTSSFECIGSAWGLDVPTGNARLTRSWSVLVRGESVGSLERHLRRLELEVNLHRAGVLELSEAYAGGAPTLCTWWKAVVETCKGRRLGQEEAPPLRGAWGVLELSFILSEPRETPPGAAGGALDPEEEEPTEDESTTVEEQYATGWILLKGRLQSLQIAGKEVDYAYLLPLSRTGIERFLLDAGIPARVTSWTTVDFGTTITLEATVPGGAGEQITLVLEGDGEVSGPTLELPRPRKEEI